MYEWMDHIVSPEGQRAGGGVVRRGAGEREVVRADGGPRTTAPPSTPTTRRTSTKVCVLDDADEAVRRRRAERSARTTPNGSRPGPRSRAERAVDSRSERQRPGGLRGTLAGLLLRPPAACQARAAAARRPLGWLVVAYLGSLAVLFVAALLAARPVHRRDRPASYDASTTSSTLSESDVYRHDRAADDRDRRARSRSPTRCSRFPIAFFMAKVASPRVRGAACRRDPHAAVGELPREGLRLAGRSSAEDGRPELGARAVRPQRAPASGNVAIVARVQLPLAAVHDPARSTPASSASRTRCSRRRATSARRPWHDVPARRPAARRYPASSPGRSSPSRSRSATTSRRSWSRPRSSSATSSTPTSAWRTTCRSPRRSPPCPIVIMIVYLLDRAAARRVRGALMDQSRLRPARRCASAHGADARVPLRCRSLVVALYAFNESRVQRLAARRASRCEWFSRALDNPGARDALWHVGEGRRSAPR